MHLATKRAGVCHDRFIRDVHVDRHHRVVKSILVSSSLSSTDFLTLLTSELQNRNPLDATSTTDFINQLTSYANFTEQQSINSNMSSLASSFASLVTLNSVNYIGHTVEAKTDTSTLSNG